MPGNRDSLPLSADVVDDLLAKLVMHTILEMPISHEVDSRGGGGDQSGFKGLSSLGSSLHLKGECKPCPLVVSIEGCPFGVLCPMCHMLHKLDENPKVLTKAEKIQAKKAREKVKSETASMNGRSPRVGGPYEGSAVSSWKGEQVEQVERAEPVAPDYLRHYDEAERRKRDVSLPLHREENENKTGTVVRAKRDTQGSAQQDWKDEMEEDEESSEGEGGDEREEGGKRTALGRTEGNIKAPSLKVKEVSPRSVRPPASKPGKSSKAISPLTPRSAQKNSGNNKQVSEIPSIKSSISEQKEPHKVKTPSAKGGAKSKSKDPSFHGDDEDSVGMKLEGSPNRRLKELNRMLRGEVEKEKGGGEEEEEEEGEEGDGEHDDDSEDDEEQEHHEGGEKTSKKKSPQKAGKKKKGKKGKKGRR